MNKELFQEYADIKNAIAILEEKAEKIRADVAKDMEVNDVEEVKSDWGTFYFTTRKTYKYSQKVDELNTQLKEQKKKEESDGIAIATESKSLTFRAK